MFFIQLSVSETCLQEMAEFLEGDTGLSAASSDEFDDETADIAVKREDHEMVEVQTALRNFEVLFVFRERKEERTQS